MKKKLFLLGGADLEMQEIERILLEHHILYYNKHLQWDNAFLSCYSDVLSLYGDDHQYELYGVELHEDIQPPGNYYRIDHHNDYDAREASIIQVLHVLGISPTHWQELIAANDSLYIPGMIQKGATPEEIKSIRLKDRQIQGVTELEERLADEAITRNMEKAGELIIVKSGTSRFSPICDRLYPYSKLLIYTDDEIVYYGEGKKDVIHLFRKQLSAKDWFHGGGGNGYCGIVKGALNGSQIEKIVEQIKKL